MKPRDRVLAALNRQPVDRIPYCDHLIDFTVARKALGPLKSLNLLKLTFPVLKEFGLKELSAIIQASDDPEKIACDPELSDRAFHLMSMAEPILSKMLYRDNITFWDGAFCFEGGKFYLLNPETPELGFAADGILKSFDDLDKLIFRTDIDRIISKAEKFLKHKGDLAACAMIYLGIDPAWHSMGIETFSMACLQEPDLVGEVLGRITDWYADMAVELCKLDFDFIWAADDIAFSTGPFFSPKVYRNVLLPHTRKVAEKITKPWIYHSDGNLLPIWEDLTSQGMNAIHPLEAGSMDLKQLKSDYGKDISFAGGMDLRILEAGTPEETREFTEFLIETLGPTGYIYGSSNSITAGVKPENYRAMIDTILEKG